GVAENGERPSTIGTAVETGVDSVHPGGGGRARRSRLTGRANEPEFFLEKWLSFSGSVFILRVVGGGGPHPTRKIPNEPRRTWSGFEQPICSVAVRQLSKPLQLPELITLAHPGTFGRTRPCQFRVPIQAQT